MSIGANSYGSVAGVAALVPRYATGDAFVSATRPTLTQVESFIDMVSGILNVQLSNAGFTVPISQADAKLALDWFVEQEVASICEGINGSGRFGPTAKQTGTRYSIISKDVQDFVSTNAPGFARLGAARPYSKVGSILTRSTDERGNATYPIFQRSAFGNDAVQLDWDSD